MSDQIASARSRRARSIAVTLSTAAILLATGVYAAVVGITPLPELQPTVQGERTVAFSVATDDLQRRVDAFAAPTATGWSIGEVFSNDGDTPRPLASITKLVTALVCLEERPLAPGDPGATYTWTAADAAMQDRLRAQLAIVTPTAVGARVSERDMLTLMLLPSSNDYAVAYANWVFGSPERFVAATAAWAERHGLASLRIVEASGLEAGNVASAADLVTVGRLALDNPTVLELTSMRRATIPGVGVVENTNPMLGRAKGVIGFKTGTTDVAGKNLLLAQRSTMQGREVVTISAVLGRSTTEARIADSRAILDALGSSSEEAQLVERGELVGTVTTWQGERVELHAADSTSSALLPGETATRTIALAAVGAADSGSPAGEISIDGPVASDPVPVVTAARIAEPDYWWRFTHPEVVFGWGRSSGAG